MYIKNLNVGLKLREVRKQGIPKEMFNPCFWFDHTVAIEIVCQK